MVLDGQLDHFQARRPREQALSALVRRVVGGDEHDPIEREGLSRGLGQQEVAEVDWIERPAKHPNSHHLVGSTARRQ